MEEFAELLARLDENPLDDLSVEELTEARDKIVAYGRELRDGAETVEDTDQLVEDATALAGMVTRINTELEARETAAAANAEALGEAFSAFDETEETTEEVTEEVVEEVDEPVVASAPALADIASRRPPAPEPDPVTPTLAVVASVGNGAAPGTQFADRDALTRGLYEGWRKGPQGSTTVARYDLEFPTRTLGADPYDNWSILEGIKRDAQKARQNEDATALTAAGFCAPAEPVYNFLGQDIASRDGLIQLPTASANRGRVTYPELRNVRDAQVQAGVAWETTGTMDEDAVEKPCWTIACGTGATFDVKAYSTCLRFSNFDSQFWPERVAFATSQALIAHDHEVSLALILAIVADGRATTVIDGHLLGGTWVQFIQSLALHGGFIRSRFRLPLSTVLEAAVPSYVLDALVADQVARDSTTTYAMAIAQVEEAARRARVNVQWVYDWQEQDHPNWPADYDYLIWPSGTVVQLSGGTLDLGITRDSTLNVANDFQSFTETFDGHAIIGPGVYVVTGVNLCPTGGTGNRVAVDCAAGS